MTMKDLLDRYGPTIAVIAVLALLIVVMPDDRAGPGSDVSAVGTAPTDVATTSDQPVDGGAESAG
jgi:hypothetical protein